MNNGNFLEIMELISEKDPIIKARLSSKNAKCTSPTIQNEIIGIMAETFLDEITDKLYQSTWFSIMVDESKDISGREQLFVVVRYLFDHTLHEEFLGFIRLHELNAEYPKNSICEMLLTCNIDAKNCIGQTYDGASVMNGTNAGAQRLFREEAAPEAPYIHCYDRCLNLVIVDVVKSVKIAD
ncbi:zinc finger MYM-type protein 1-like [Macrobrachium rosenbergii]|uniref:zinc finger MYM-type protein 1-like n=1 Tax=Macrobrachium rosenbergii TaxID=79674 RepID=UPI0034D432AE